VCILKNTTSDDYSFWKKIKDAGGVDDIYTGVTSWSDVATDVSGFANHSIDTLYISGHEYGVRQLGAPDATDGAKIAIKMKGGALVEIDACYIANYDLLMQAIANELHTPVKANLDIVKGGKKGVGDWIEWHC
jgi:hypothetical protein